MIFSLPKLTPLNHRIWKNDRNEHQINHFLT
ncbi:MAG: hypothetical protein UZ11_BCD004000972 [Bacteroidetes bacterium OLB11]|nr:MAG: hypothetical protein UZ11_BCD004000972 [Bacteroidetes bacterium OLB11]